MLFDEWWGKNWEGVGKIADDAGKFIARAAWDAATGYERNACAILCESMIDIDDDYYGEAEQCADAIRARSND